MYDLTKAKNKEMQAFAKRVGFKDIFLISSDVKDADAFLIEKVKDYKKEVLKARKRFVLVIVSGNGDVKRNREIVEASPDVLLSPSLGKRDFMKERNSGLDHIICKIAAKNKVAIGIHFNEILYASEKQRAVILGRIMQNIKLCRKYKVGMLLATFASSLLEMRAVQDLIAFAQAIGMTPVEAKKSLSMAAEIVRRNKEKKKPEYVAEGIRILK